QAPVTRDTSWRGLITGFVGHTPPRELPTPTPAASDGRVANSAPALGCENFTAERFLYPGMRLQIFHKYGWMQ
ncbi:hypothetical protein, partial [Streptomyces microflavus]|uniref:hypothetical protein n=1 Tax=Streptomyces microflavus TaxID=1919 RepID=UPI0036BEA4C6